MEVIGVVTDTAPSSGKGVRYGVFGRRGVTALIVEVLLGVGGFDVDRGAEMTMVNTDIDVQKSDMGGGSVPGEVDRIPTVELFKEIISSYGSPTERISAHLQLFVKSLPSHV